MKTRHEIEVGMERASAALAHYVELDQTYRDTTSIAYDLVQKWQRAHGDWQQINHLTGTPSYEALEAENKRLRDELATKQPPSQDAEYGELRALAERVANTNGKSSAQIDFDDYEFEGACGASTILAILNRNAQLAERVAVLEAALRDIAGSKPLTATPQQFADHLQREARAALTAHPHADEAAKVGVLCTSAPFGWQDAINHIREHIGAGGFAENAQHERSIVGPYLDVVEEALEELESAPPSPAEGKS